jgi:hypothetical protein
MRKTVFAAVSILLFAGLAFGYDKPLAVSEIVKKLDSTRQSSAAIRSYAREIKFKQAEGTGKVIDILDDNRANRYRVTILSDGAFSQRGYNVVLYTAMHAPAELKRDQKIRFKGEVGRISTHRGTSIDIHGNYEVMKPAETKKKKK